MKNDREYLGHILEAIEQIEKIVAGFDFEKFSSDYRTLSAVKYLLAIIGKASNNLSEDIYEQNPEIPWSNIISMRNVLIHVYFDADLQTIWDTVITDLPMFKKQIDLILRSL